MAELFDVARSVSLERQLEGAERELRLRRQVYPNRVAQKRMTQAKADEATENDPDSAATKALVGQAKAAAGKTDALFKGETLRGLLLTTYGFSIFGERAEQAALVCFAVAAVLALATVAGLVHAAATSKAELVLPEVPHDGTARS